MIHNLREILPQLILAGVLWAILVLAFFLTRKRRP